MSGSYGYNDFEAILESSDFGWFMEEYGLMILGILGIILLTALLFGLLTYILSSVGLYTIAKRRGIENPWMAWIPMANYWTMGCISDQYQYVVNGKVRNKRKTLLILAVAPTVFSFISGIIQTVTTTISIGIGESMAGSLIVSVIIALANAGLSLAMMIVYFITLNDIYNSCSARNGTVFLVLSILFSVLVPFFFFALRKKDGGMPPRREPVVNPAYQQSPAFIPPVAPVDVPPVPEVPAADEQQEFL